MKKTIAIIDDETEMEFLYKIMLEELVGRNPLDVKYFSNAKTFLKWIEHNNPQLILSDIDMPFQCGIDLGRDVRQLNRSVPIYFISGYEEERFKNKLSKFSYYRYLSKPFNVDSFLNFVKTDLCLC